MSVSNVLLEIGEGVQRRGGAVGNNLSFICQEVAYEIIHAIRSCSFIDLWINSEKTLQERAWRYLKCWLNILVVIPAQIITLSLLTVFALFMPVTSQNLAESVYNWDHKVLPWNEF